MSSLETHVEEASRASGQIEDVGTGTAALARAVSVVIPALDEAAHVADEIEGVAAQLELLDWSYEIIVVDDGSSDETAERAAAAGARSAAYIMLRLPHGVKDLFEGWLERHYPERREKVMNRVRAIRDGRLNDPRFHTRMRGNLCHRKVSQRSRPKLLPCFIGKRGKNLCGLPSIIGGVRHPTYPYDYQRQNHNAALRPTVYQKLAGLG